jgi:hypothetical protein
MRNERSVQWRMVVSLFLLLLAGLAQADIFQPAYLELRETADEQYDVLWKVPALGSEQRLAAYVVFPEGTEQITEPRAFISDGAWIERWRIRHVGSLVGKIVVIEGSAAAATDIIARVERSDGTSQVERLSPGALSFEVRATEGTSEIAWSYTVLGIEHILGGYDHLLFVFALLLIVRGGRRIVATITAFTIAHSITLAAATLGWVHVAGPPVEAIIALSIAFVAAEVIHGLRGVPGLTARAPWLVAFSFGLLHGFGFAGALAEVGLPQVAIPVALLMFNVGVEIGQLMFVGAVFAFAMLARNLLVKHSVRLMPIAAYGIGTIAAFWTIERVISF